MYWIDSNTNHSRINKASMDGLERVTITESENNFTGLTLDLTQSKVYWSKRKEIGYIYSNGTNSTQRFNQDDLMITSVMSFNGSLFYAHSHGQYGEVLPNRTLAQPYVTYLCFIGLQQSKVVSLHQQIINGKYIIESQHFCLCMYYTLRVCLLFVVQVSPPPPLQPLHNRWYSGYHSWSAFYYPCN